MKTPHAPITPDDTDPRPVAPDAPLPSECCDSGCPICVHDLHAEAMAQYRLDLAAWEARQSRRDAGNGNSGG